MKKISEIKYFRVVVLYINKGMISSDLEDKNKPYTTIISFEGGKHGKQ